MSTQQKGGIASTTTCFAVVVLLSGCRGADPSPTEAEITLDVALSVKITSPVLVSPANGRGIGVPLIVPLRWKPVVGANLYEVEVAKDTSYRWIFFSALTESLTIRTTQLEPRRYYWHVKAYLSGRETEWSTTWWFLQLSLP